MKTSDITSLDTRRLSLLSDRELSRYLSTARENANRRLARLERVGGGPAYYSQSKRVQEHGFRGPRGLTRRQRENELQTAIHFLRDPTSTTGGLRKMEAGVGSYYLPGGRRIRFVAGGAIDPNSPDVQVERGDTGKYQEVYESLDLNDTKTFWEVWDKFKTSNAAMIKKNNLDSERIHAKLRQIMQEHPSRSVKTIIKRAETWLVRVDEENSRGVSSNDEFEEVEDWEDVFGRVK